jgi:hypothetical protein
VREPLSVKNGNLSNDAQNKNAEQVRDLQQGEIKPAVTVLTATIINFKQKLALSQL